MLSEMASFKLFLRTPMKTPGSDGWITFRIGAFPDNSGGAIESLST